MSADNRPSGIFCANDAMAVGLLTVAKEQFNLSVPNELAIVGFDDIPMSSWPCFQVTTIRNPVLPTAKEVVRLLNLRRFNPEHPSQIIRIEPVLIIRNTA
ncbi:MAG: substrate-binding domain-containing protein [Hyphomicrobiales bacterium]